MRLLRPYVPLEVRCRVVLRQLGHRFPESAMTIVKTLADRTIAPKHRKSIRASLNDAIDALAHKLNCTPADLHLDHDPALGAREKVWSKGEHIGYRPDANDPEYLVYREKHDHHLKTNVRGEGAQHPDRVLIKKERRRARGVTKKASRPWPKRKMQGRSDWPKRKFPKRSRHGTPA
jgi:hypothetical protein